MRKGTTFHKVACSYCNREIGRNMMDYHIYNKCKEYPKVVAQRETKRKAERIEYAKTAPINDPALTIGEVKEAGRWEEFKEYMKKLRENKA